MKKIIVAICGIILSGGAMAAPEHYQEPKYQGFSPDYWKVSTINGTNYTKPLTDYGLYTNLSAQMQKVSSTNHGTNEDEGAVVLIIAHDIYDNGKGGNFCMTQIQAANQNGRQYTWLDYYKNPGKYKCEKLCRPGYYGTDCSKTDAPACKTENLDFGQYNKQATGKWTNQITSSVEVFLRNNAEGTSATTADHRVLAVVKKMDHGVIVSPVEIIGERYQSGTWDGKYSYIKSVKSNGQEFLLCAQGYEANSSKTDCVKPAWCDKKTMLDNLCYGYTTSQYREGEHKLVDGEGDCVGKTVIRCAYDGYGFDKSSSDRTCIPCNENRKSGIDSDGVCQKCTTNGDYFDGTECAPGTPIPLRQLVDGITGTAKCWLKSTLSEYRDCVRCSDGQKWNDSTKQCE